MNTKMATNTQLSPTESKNKLSKQAEQEQNHRYGDYSEGYQLGGGMGKWGKGCGIRKYKLVVIDSHGM